MYTGNPKGGKDGTCKARETTKTVEEHVKCKETDTSIQATRKEPAENKSTDTANQPPLKECKPLTFTPPQKSDSKTSAECKASSKGQTAVHKIIPSEQERDSLHRTTNSPKQECSHDMNGKQKRYTGKLIGGVLLLLATVIAVS
jgi:hypothetical protein